MIFLADITQNLGSPDTHFQYNIMILRNIMISTDISRNYHDIGGCPDRLLGNKTNG